MYHVSLKKKLCNKVFVIQNFMEICYKNLRKSWKSNIFKRIVNRFWRAGYSLDIMRQTAYLNFNPIIIEGYAALFSCAAVVQVSDSMTASM